MSHTLSPFLLCLLHHLIFSLFPQAIPSLFTYLCKILSAIQSPTREDEHNSHVLCYHVRLGFDNGTLWVRLILVLFSLRPKPEAHTLEIISPLLPLNPIQKSQQPSSFFSPTIHTRASKYGGWKVSIYHHTPGLEGEFAKGERRAMRLTRLSTGTRDCPRARRVSRRRPSTPSPARTGFPSRYDFLIIPIGTRL